MPNSLLTRYPDVVGGHVGLDRWCGICADEIVLGDRAVALFGEPASAEYRGHTHSFVFPKVFERAYYRDPRVTVDGWDVCNNEWAECGVCSRLPIEFVTVHHDCIEIFLRHCTATTNAALASLWIAAAWRKPWRAGPLLPHLTAAVIIDRDSLGIISRSASLPQLERLPLELLEMVRDHSPRSLLWRCFPTLQLAAHLSAASPKSLVTLPLASLLAWERGGKFTQASNTRPPAYNCLRLAIDSYGLHKVERLPGWPAYAGESSTRHGFIIQDESDILDVVAQLKNGRLRLQVPTSPTGPLVVWNTPAPPSAQYQAALFRPCNVRHVVNLEEATGITFFFNLGRVLGIHVHHSAESCAMDTAKRVLSPNMDAEWMYLPLSRGDPPIALGTRATLAGDLSILVRTQRAGGVVLGRHYDRAPLVTDQVLSAARPITMIYGEPPPGQGLSVFGAHPSLSPYGANQPAPFSVAYPRPNPLGEFLISYFSWAPLTNVSSTVTYYDEASGRCRGIIFHYEGGGARAVGECRLHVDRAERVDRPVRLCFWTETVPTQNTSVVYRVWARFEQRSLPTPANEPGHLPAYWTAWPMRGIVKFWFRGLTSFLAVEDCLME